MKILYLIDHGIVGGIQNHVKCLASCLTDEHEVVVCVYGQSGPTVDSMVEAGVRVVVLRGRNGHDVRALVGFRRLMKNFQPDVVHAHVLGILPLVYFCILDRQTPLIFSHHMPPTHSGLVARLLSRRIDYRLAVSTPTMQKLKFMFPNMHGEVFYNPLKITEHGDLRGFGAFKGDVPIVGMVGRNSDQKDWPSFHRVETLVKSVMPEVVFLNAGENALCNGREAISRMDLFIMTSRHEELPTTLLEAFDAGVPTCGFLPEGGVSEIIEFSNGAIKDSFIDKRDCRVLADIVCSILRNPKRRLLLALDGRNVLCKHFDAKLLCSEQLVPIYRKVIDSRGAKWRS